jgi:hypothetical protein
MTEKPSFVYRIRDAKTGLWSMGGYYPSFNKKGKTWSNLSGAMNHLGCCRTDPRSEHWELISIQVVTTPGNSTPIKDIFAKWSKRDQLSKEHGQEFANLVTVIEDRGLNEEFSWAMSFRSYGNNSVEFLAFKEALKQSKLKMGKDYMMRTSQGDAAIAFKNKTDAMRFRLLYTHPIKGIDIVNYVETDLDTSTEDAK